MLEPTETGSHTSVFANHVRMIHFDGRDVWLVLAEKRPRLVEDTKADYSLCEVARLVLSPLTAAVLHEQLTNMVQLFEQQGLIKRLSPGTATTQ